MGDQSLDPSVKDQSATVSDDQQAPVPTQNQNDTVDYATYSRTLEEAKKAKAKVREYEAADNKRKQKELEEQGQYQELLKKKDDELNEFKKILNEKSEAEANRTRMSAILDAIGGPVDKKWFKVIPYDEVELKDDGTVDQKSVSKIVNSLKAEFPEMLKKSSSVIPADFPRGGAKAKYSPEEYKNMSPKERKKVSPGDILID